MSDNKGLDLAAYFTSDAENFARSIVKSEGREDLSSQLRKFYGDLKVIERKIHQHCHDEETFTREYLPLIMFEKAKIAYNAGRVNNKKPLLPTVFKKHMDAQIDRVKSMKDFAGEGAEDLSIT